MCPCYTLVPHFLGAPYLPDGNIGSPKKMWKAINKVLGKKENSVKVSSVEIEGNFLTRERGILEALNQHFVSVGPNLAKKITAKLCGLSHQSGKK